MGTGYSLRDAFCRMRNAPILITLTEKFSHVILQDMASAIKHLKVPSELYLDTMSKTANGLQRVHHRKQFLHVFSAHDEATLKKNIQQIEKYLEHHSKSNLDLAYTLGVRRSHLYCGSYRITSSGDDVENPITKKPLPLGKRLSHQPALAFAFTGELLL
jgi:thiamine kinase-like enzyme